ncbi:MAG: hypothetical protein NT116_01930 [Candidatus Parcubacteria bacterium]|nr:hypothetical protein [Candidatus Parcubacteria bacterium]
METVIIKPNIISKTISKTLNLIKSSWQQQLKIIFTVLVAIALLLIILTIIWQILIKINIITLANIITAQIIWQVISAIIFFLVAAAAQYLLINQLLNLNLKLKENLAGLKKYWAKFLCLTIIINLIFLLATLPLYVAVFLILLKSYVLGILTLIVGLATILFLAAYLVISPFLLIDKKLFCIESIKKSFKLIENNFWQILIKIVILSVILLILNLLSFILISLPYFGALLSGLILIIMIMLAFSYLAILYQDLKILKNF